MNKDNLITYWNNSITCAESSDLTEAQYEYAKSEGALELFESCELDYQTLSEIDEYWESTVRPTFRAIIQSKTGE